MCPNSRKIVIYSSNTRFFDTLWYFQSHVIHEASFMKCWLNLSSQPKMQVLKLRRKNTYRFEMRKWMGWGGGIYTTLDPRIIVSFQKKPMKHVVPRILMKRRLKKQDWLIHIRNFFEEIKWWSQPVSVFTLPKIRAEWMMFGVPIHRAP